MNTPSAIPPDTAPAVNLATLPLVFNSAAFLAALDNSFPPSSPTLK